MNKLALAMMATSLLSGCANQAVREIGRAPSMSPIGSGLQYAQTPQMAMYPKQPDNRMTGYSIWSDSQANLFRDLRAINVGDVLTVKIRLNDEAAFDNKTNRSRVNKSGMNFGISGQTQDTSIDTKGDLNYGSSTSTKGDGKTERSERLSLMVAAVVTGVLENGNLLISGSQEVRGNFEVRVLNIAGIVRPRDISRKNTISYDKIAEARVSYGGRGRLMEVQQPAYGQQIYDVVAPF